MEGELARTIRSVDNIKNARVHLVLPKREMFSREEQAPTASVVIKTVKGQLSPQSIQAIQKLVAASVPKLDVKNVAIVDNAGVLLTQNYEDPEAMTAANNELMRLEQERKMGIRRCKTSLERTVGEEKFVRRSIWKWISIRLSLRKKFMIRIHRSCVLRRRLPKRD